MLRSALLIASAVLLAAPTATHAQLPANYYDSVGTTNAGTLRQTLHGIIDDHARFPYTSTATDTWDILEEADEDPQSSNNILDVYRNMSVTKQGGGNSFYNREHTWPKSYGFPNNNSSNYPYTDCHMLFLSDSRYNSSRSNKPYRSCTATCTEKTTEVNTGQGGGTGAHPANSNWTSGSHATGGWETWVGRRGDVARALFYMDVRYEGGTHGDTNAAEPDLVLTNDESLIAASNTGNNERTAHMGMLSVLLEWHSQDPVDDLERSRNDAVHGHQGNRNPFIDHPEWVACIFAGNCTAGTPGGGTQVWINEFHYDNKDADEDEFVEIAGPAGSDLTSWLLIGYNGRTGGVYRTVSLSGTIPDEQNGFGALAFDFPGLQNGAPDGIALVDAGGSTVEFLSYEGAFVASNGPVAGTQSTQTNVEESSTTRKGHSLQRSGTGSDPTLLNWQGPRKRSRGQLNHGQSF